MRCLEGAAFSPQGIDTAHPALSKCLYSPYSSRKLPIHICFPLWVSGGERYKHLAGTKLNLAPGKCLCTPECFFFSPLSFTCSLQKWRRLGFSSRRLPKVSPQAELLTRAAGQASLQLRLAIEAAGSGWEWMDVHGSSHVAGLPSLFVLATLQIRRFA